MAAQWSPFTAYAVGDVVSYIGLEYSATVANINTAPFPATPTWAPVVGPLPPGAVTNPLTGDLDCASFDVFNGTRFNTATVECDTIDPLPGSIATEITVGQSLRVVGVSKNLETEADVLGRVGAPNQSSLNTVFDNYNIVGGFYKTSDQSMPTGAHDITWDASYGWGDALGCFTITPGSAAITCAVQGVYEIAVNMNNAAGTSAAAGTNIRILSFDLTRSPNPRLNGFINSTFYNQTNTGYNQVVQGVVELLVGDVLDVRVQQTLSSGSSSVLGVNGLDPNTWMTYSLRKRLP
jgi:hypothetical protein